METERDRYQRCLIELAVGDALEDVSNAMLELAKSLPPSELAEKTYALCEKFRPEIPPGKKGWGASGKLELDLIRHAVKVVSLPRRKE